MAATSSAGTWELYHVSADRAEIRNVAAQYPEKTAELAALWETAAGRESSRGRRPQSRRRASAAAWARPAAPASGSRVAGGAG